MSTRWDRPERARSTDWSGAAKSALEVVRQAQNARQSDFALMPPRPEEESEMADHDHTERRARYMDALRSAPRKRDGRNLERQAEAVMALADAEHSDLEAEKERLRAELSGARQVGRCGNAAPRMNRIAPEFCALPAGHAGWHKGTEFMDSATGVLMATEWSAGGGDA